MILHATCFFAQLYRGLTFYHFISLVNSRITFRRLGALSEDVVAVVAAHAVAVVAVVAAFVLANGESLATSAASGDECSAEDSPGTVQSDVKMFS